MTELEYAKRGLIGVLTPQANTTVEPEYSILWPAGVSMINARLTNPKEKIEDRLVDYTNQVEGSLHQFSNAPLQAVIFAYTGASYLMGHDKEADLCKRMEKTRGYPFVTAARGDRFFECSGCKKDRTGIALSCLDHQRKHRLLGERGIFGRRSGGCFE